MKYFVIPSERSKSRNLKKRSLHASRLRRDLVGITVGIVFLTFAFLLLTFHEVSAVTMESSRFKIESANVTTGSGNSSSPGYKISDTLGQMAAGQFSSTGYVVKAGFQYLHSIVPFRFSISDTSIDFGNLVPNTPVTATTNLTVSFGGAGQYQVTAIEEGQLKTQSGNAIPDTSCDGNDCDETTATVWNSSNTYGFGYKMADEDVPVTFTNCGSLCYRRFPDRTAVPTPEPPAVVMSSGNVTVDLTSKPKDISHTSTVTFKTNISPIQPVGSYQTIINFVATPSF